MKKILPMLLAAILIVLTLSSCSLSIKDLGSDDTESDTSTNTGITPGENELPGIPLTSVQVNHNSF